jgi:hypothetical protein
MCRIEGQAVRMLQFAADSVLEATSIPHCASQFKAPLIDMSVFNAESEHPPGNVAEQWWDFSSRGSNVYTQ